MFRSFPTISDNKMVRIRHQSCSLFKWRSITSLFYATRHVRGYCQSYSPPPISKAKQEYCDTVILPIVSLGIISTLLRYMSRGSWRRGCREMAMKWRNQATRKYSSPAAVSQDDGNNDNNKQTKGKNRRKTKQNKNESRCWSFSVLSIDKTQ